MSKLILDIKAYKNLNDQDKNLAVYLIAFLENLGLIKITGVIIDDKWINKQV